MRPAARQKRTRTQMMTMTTMRGLETDWVLVAAVESAEPLLAEVEDGDGAAVGDALTCTASGLGDEVGSESSVVVGSPAEEAVLEDDSESETGVVVGSAESEVELGSEESLVSVGLAVPVLVSVVLSLLSANLRLKDWNVIWLVLLNLVSGMFVTVIVWMTVGSRATTVNRTTGVASSWLIRSG